MRTWTSAGSSAPKRSSTAASRSSSAWRTARTVDVAMEHAGAGATRASAPAVISRMKTRSARRRHGTLQRPTGRAAVHVECVVLDPVDLGVEDEGGDRDELPRNGGRE